MTRTEVTGIVRIVFFLWLVASIALGLTTIVALLPLSDQRHGHEEAERTRVQWRAHEARAPTAHAAEQQKASAARHV
jgi:hypothetical protein